MIGHEKRIESSGFKFLRESGEMLEVEIGIGQTAWITPAASVNRGRPHESAESHFAHGVGLRTDSMIGLNLS
jgi:hypothetical protein